MKNRDKDIGLGVVGTGLGALLLRVNREKTSTRLWVRGIHDPDPGRAHQRYEVSKTLADLAAEFKVDFIAPSYEELLAREDIRCIAVFSPCPNHYEQIKKALLAGKHVIVTKPMVVSMAEARDIVALTERSGLKLLVAQSMRWNSMFMAIQRLAAGGGLGEIQFAEAYYMHDLRPVLDVSPWRYQLPQDYLYGGACHPADLLRWCLGEVDEVFAYAIRGKLDQRYPKENIFIISLKYRNGAIARILDAHDLVHPPNLWKHPFHGVGIGLYGTKASLFNDRIVHDYYGKGRPEEQEIEPVGGHTTHEGEVLALVHHFEACLVEDKKPLVDVRDGAQVIAICAACWESIHTGRPVKVSREFDRA